MAGRSQKFSGQYWDWLAGGAGGAGGGMFWKNPHGFCVAEGAPIEGASVAAAAPMLFLFSALRTFGICVRASQRSPSIAFPQHPPPSTLLSLPPLPLNFEPAGAAMHLHQNEELAGTECLGHIPLAGGAVFPYLAESVLHDRS